MNEEKTIVSANPKIASVGLGLSQRAIGRLIDLPLASGDVGQAQADLAGDLFWSLYSQDTAARPIDQLPGSRQINAALLDWLKSSGGWPKMQEATTANMAATLATTPLAWLSLNSEDALEEALKKQKEAEEKEKEAAAAQASADAMDQASQAEGLSPEDASALAQAAAAAGQKAASARQAAAEAVQAAAEALEEAQGDRKAQARIKAKMGQAAEDAEEIAHSMASYGLGPGDPAHVDPKAASRFLELYEEKIKKIAKLAGRMAGVATQQSREKIKTGQNLGEVKLTKKLQDVALTELAFLRPDAPPMVRAQKAIDFLSGGLPGYSRHGEAKEEGPVVIAVDGSGSMAGDPDIVAKAVAIGVAQAVRDGGRPFTLISFSSRANQIAKYESDQPWDQLMQWAAHFQGGGTNFDTAFAAMFESLDELSEKAAGADVIFISDGAGQLSQSSKDRWQDYKADHGTRFMFVPVGGFNPHFIGDLPDRFLRLNDLSQDSGEELAAAMGEWIR